MELRLRNRDPKDHLFNPEFVPDRQDGITDSDIAFEHELGEGASRKIALDGLWIHRGWHRVDRDVVLTAEQDTPNVELHFCLKGGVSAQIEGVQEPIHARPGTQLMWYDPTPQFDFSLDEDVRHERFEVNLSMEYFASLVERYPELLETAFSQIERRQPFFLHPEGRFITPRMKSIIRQILHSHEQGALRRVFIEAKVTELLVLQLRQHRQHEDRLYRETTLSRREVDRMIEARDRVLARIDDPPTLQELARQVGTNEFKLKKDFKAVFGDTVYGLLLKRKMEHARALLLDTNRLIGDIAQEVGYSHPAHFSTAFKKTFGVSPSSFRD